MKFSSAVSGEIRGKKNSAKATIRQHLTRAFERGATRHHRVITGSSRVVCYVFHRMEDSSNKLWTTGAFFFLGCEAFGVRRRADSHCRVPRTNALVACYVSIIFWRPPTCRYSWVVSMYLPQHCWVPSPSQVHTNLELSLATGNGRRICHLKTSTFGQSTDALWTDIPSSHR